MVTSSTYTKSLVYKIFNRIDIQCECSNLSFNDISKMKAGESSASTRERVIKARNI